ncbi:MAG: undecaprenyl-diphosphate phosphatase [Clostridia bacterium]|nr:undecaprenyl-diphosphate phosphatase [Clostridia bacterium]
MNYLYSVLFGIIEGVTEWLPISSTGHLILAQTFMKFKDLSPDFWSVFEVVIQLGAIMAVVILYFSNICPIKFEKSEKKLKWDKSIFNLWVKIIISCIPAILIVVLKVDEVADKYFYNPTTIAIMLIIVGIAFIFVERFNKNKKDYRVNDVNDISYKDAVIIGLFQLIAAIFPGTSRSGATIIGALLIGISRVISAEYTFYLAIPVMFGASLLKVLKYGLAFSTIEWIVLIIGIVISFVISMIVIKFLMDYIKKHNFEVFGWYRIVIGIIVLALIVFKII